MAEGTYWLQTDSTALSSLKLIGYLCFLRSSIDVFHLGSMLPSFIHTGEALDISSFLSFICPVIFPQIKLLLGFCFVFFFLLSWHPYFWNEVFPHFFLPHCIIWFLFLLKLSALNQEMRWPYNSLQAAGVSCMSRLGHLMYSLSCSN